MRTLRDVSRDFEASGEIVTLSTCEVNTDLFAMPARRVHVSHGAATTHGPYDLGCEQPSILLIARRIEMDAPRQACRRE